MTWANAADPEGEAISYDVEVYDGDTDRPPAQTATVAQAAGGMTTWTPATMSPPSAERTMMRPMFQPWRFRTCPHREVCS